MLKGQTYDEQLFQSEAFRLFMNTFLNGNSGVIKGCTLSNTTTSVTLSDGFFMIKGGVLQEYGGETLTPESDGYYYLVCEIDLSQTNTELAFNQGSLKLIRGASVYPTLVQEDIVGSGTVYQYPFAQFRVVSGSITGFTDVRTFLNYASIYDIIRNEADALIQELRDDLEDVVGTVHEVTHSKVIQDYIYESGNKKGYYVLTLKKVGNVIYVRCEIGVDANVTSMGSFINITENFPDWAKPTANMHMFKQESTSGFATATISGYTYLTPMSVMQIDLYKQVNDFRLGVNYETGDFASTSSENKFEFSGSYLTV